MALARVWIALGALSVGTLVGPGVPQWMPVAAGFIGAVALARRRRPLASLAGVAAIALGAGAFGSLARSSDGSALSALASSAPRCGFSGRILEQAGGLGTLVELAAVQCAGRAELRGAGAAIVDSLIGEPGAPIAGDGWLLPLGDSSFDRARTRAGALAQLDPEHVQVAPVPPGPLAVASAVRGGVRSVADELGGRRGGLVLGLGIGDTSRLDAVTMERFRNAGLSHLLAVSGSNVAIVLGAVAIVGRRLGLRARLGISFGGLVLFVLVVGPDPSVLRAAVMGGIALAALGWGRTAEPLHALGLALVVVIAVRPGMVHSVGLHLSAAATAGIVLWTRPVAAQFRALPAIVAFPLAATIAAQWAVAPILIAVFGRISLAGPLANVLAVPAVPPATILGLLGGVAEAVVPGFGTLSARAAGPFAGWIVGVGDAFGRHDWSALSTPRWVAAALAVPVVLTAVVALRGHLPSRRY